MAEDGGECRGLDGPVCHGPDPTGRELPATRVPGGDTCFHHDRPAYGARSWNAGGSNRGARRKTTLALDPRRNRLAWAREECLADLHQQRVGCSLSISRPGCLSICRDRARGRNDPGLRHPDVGGRVGSSPRVRGDRDPNSSSRVRKVEPADIGSPRHRFARGDRTDLAGRFPPFRSDCDLYSAPGVGSGHASLRRRWAEQH